MKQPTNSSRKNDDMQEIQTIKIGDRVRSHDFPERLLPASTRKPCYAEGVVESITDPATHEFRDCARYQIRVERRVFSGEEVTEFEPHVFPPVNGTVSWLGSPVNGVKRVEGGAV